MMRASWGAGAANERAERAVFGGLAGEPPFASRKAGSVVVGIDLRSYVDLCVSMYRAYIYRSICCCTTMIVFA